MKDKRTKAELLDQLRAADVRQKRITSERDADRVDAVNEAARADRLQGRCVSLVESLAAAHAEHGGMEATLESVCAKRLKAEATRDSAIAGFRVAVDDAAEATALLTKAQAERDKLRVQRDSALSQLSLSREAATTLDRRLAVSDSARFDMAGALGAVHQILDDAQVRGGADSGDPADVVDRVRWLAESEADSVGVSDAVISTVVRERDEAIAELTNEAARADRAQECLGVAQRHLIEAREDVAAASYKGNSVHHWWAKAHAYGGMVRAAGPLLKAAGHAVDARGEGGAREGFPLAVAALIAERDEARNALAEEGRKTIDTWGVHASAVAEAHRLLDDAGFLPGGASLVDRVAGLLTLRNSTLDEQLTEVVRVVYSAVVNGKKIDPPLPIVGGLIDDLRGYTAREVRRRGDVARDDLAGALKDVTNAVVKGWDLCFPLGREGFAMRDAVATIREHIAATLADRDDRLARCRVVLETMQSDNGAIAQMLAELSPAPPEVEGRCVYRYPQPWADVGGGFGGFLGVVGTMMGPLRLWVLVGTPEQHAYAKQCLTNRGWRPIGRQGWQCGARLLTVAEDPARLGGALVDGFFSFVSDGPSLDDLRHRHARGL